MSYILDALRKADAERRGVPPPPTGLTEPAVLVDSDPDADLPASPARPWLWVLGGVALALAAACAWTFLSRSEPPPAPVVAVAPPPPDPVTVLPAPAPAPLPSADALPNFPPPLPDAPKPEPPPKPAPRAALPDTPPAKPVVPPGITMVPPAAAPAAGSNRVYSVNELPEDVRRDLPKLNVGGAMYSDRPAERMVVLNGQVFHEGDALGKGLVLKQIRLKSAVLEFRGYRVEIGY